MSSVPECSGLGNTITKPTINPAKRWCLTFNNYDCKDYELLIQTCQRTCSKYILGKETGEQGTNHIQGYIELTKKSRPTSIFNFTKKIHFEKANGTAEDNYKYCSKDNDFVQFGFKIKKPLKTIDELNAFQNEMINEYNKDCDDRKVLWIYNEEGELGKTTLIKYMINKGYKVLPITSGNTSDIAFMLKNFGETEDLNDKFVIIFNYGKDFLSHNINYKIIENVKDGLITSPKYESNTLVFNCPHVWVFANCEPDCDLNGRIIVKKYEKNPVTIL